MQTFLPYPDFEQSAKVLDNKRLGKQRVEAWQIYLTLTQGSRWINHPAVKMWKGYEAYLCLYGLEICKEWTIVRKFKDTLYSKFLEVLKPIYEENIKKPLWLGNTEFHLSHQSNLLRKNPEHYSRYFSNVPNNLPYIWPVK